MSEPPEQSPLFGESADEEAPEIRVPLLRLRGDSWDPLALETWQEALSGLLAPDLPHDLMALWLFPPGHEAVLIGPAALAQDNLEVPRPSPHLGQDQLYTLEQRIRAAGYPSVVCMAIPHGDRDVGLMLLADLRGGVYQLPHAVLLRSVADSLGPPLARIARQWGRVTENEDEDVPQRRKNEPGRKLADLNTLLATLGLTESTTRTPHDFAELVSRALQPLLPHDRLQILVPDASGQEHYRFDLHGHGTFWSDPAHVVSHHRFDPARVFGDAEELFVEDTELFGATVWCPGPPGIGDPVGQGREADPIRSVLAVRLVSQGRVAGYLFLGGLGPGLFRREDLELLHQVIPLVATRVDSFLLAWQLQVMRSHLSVLRNVPAQLGRISELLATTAHFGAATRLFAREAATVLPFDRIEFSLRFGDEDHVVMMGPGETKPLADLPLMAIAGTELGRVLSGEIPHAFATSRRALDPAAAGPAQPTAVLLVPLRVAGRVFGGLTLLAAGLESFTRADIALAQQLADIIAPHLELLRRASMSPSPVAPAWRRRN